MQVQRDQQHAEQFWLALLGAVRDASRTTSSAEPPAGTPDFNAPAMAGRVLSELADDHVDITLDGMSRPEASLAIGRGLRCRLRACPVEPQVADALKWGTSVCSSGWMCTPGR